LQSGCEPTLRECLMVPVLAIQSLPLNCVYTLQDWARWIEALEWALRGWLFVCGEHWWRGCSHPAVVWLRGK